jgi:hypothetical protein
MNNFMLYNVIHIRLFISNYNIASLQNKQHWRIGFNQNDDNNKNKITKQRNHTYLSLHSI